MWINERLRDALAMPMQKLAVFPSAFVIDISTKQKKMFSFKEGAIQLLGR
jgi:hypothetical protein